MQRALARPRSATAKRVLTKTRARNSDTATRYCYAATDGMRSYILVTAVGRGRRANSRASGSWAE